MGVVMTDYRVELRSMIGKSGALLKRGQWITVYRGSSKADCMAWIDGGDFPFYSVPFYLRVRGTRSPKPQAPVAAHESDKQVSAPAAPRRLPMQRVLVSPFYVLRTLFGEPISRSIRSAFPRLHPSWAPVSAAWPVAVPGSQMRLPLGPTQTACRILERDLQRQKRALRADLRAIRSGVTA